MSMIHFELIFLKGLRSVSRIIILHVDVQFFQHHLLKRLSLLHCIDFVPFSVNYVYVNLLLGSPFHSIYLFVLLPILHYLYYFGFLVILEAK